MFKLQISSIFNFDWAHQSWISGVLGIKALFKCLSFDYKSALVLIIKVIWKAIHLKLRYGWNLKFCQQRRNSSNNINFPMYVHVRRKCVTVWNWTLFDSRTSHVGKRICSKSRNTPPEICFTHFSWCCFSR